MSKEKGNAQGAGILAEQLKVKIDREGQFGQTHDDMAAGFAAGTNQNHVNAKQQINEAFEQRYGDRPYDYLGKRREEMGLSNDGQDKAQDQKKAGPEQSR